MGALMTAAGGDTQVAVPRAGGEQGSVALGSTVVWPHPQLTYLHVQPHPEHKKENEAKFSGLWLWQQSLFEPLETADPTSIPKQLQG